MCASDSGRGRRTASLAVLAILLLSACGGEDGSPTVAPAATTTTMATTSTTSGAGATTSTTSRPPSTTTTAAAGTVLAATVRGGSVVEGASRQRATLNQPVTVRIASDVADEVHVHSYDKRFDVPAGRTGEVTFVANIPGVFEVEFEKSGKLLFTLEVR